MVLYFREENYLMKQRLATVLAATAVLGITSVWAANPFSDVSPNDWAYQGVAQLASTGVINGYPDGTFKGQNTITRYEMAQMVAKAMANESRANAEQQALINRLADEFASELNSLGIRVAKLEDKVGNVKASGDVRLRYIEALNDNDESKSDGRFDYRARLQLQGNVNKNTTAVVRVIADDIEFGDASSQKLEFDNVYVAHKFGKHVTGVVGRFDAFIGNGLVYDDTFDGIAATYENKKFSATLAHGYLNELNGAILAKANKDVEKIIEGIDTSTPEVQEALKVGSYADLVKALQKARLNYDSAMAKLEYFDMLEDEMLLTPDDYNKLSDTEKIDYDSKLADLQTKIAAQEEAIKTSEMTQEVAYKALGKVEPEKVKTLQVALERQRELIAIDDDLYNKIEEWSAANGPFSELYVLQKAQDENSDLLEANDRLISETIKNLTDTFNSDKYTNMVPEITQKVIIL